jgi:hypothetical protein
MSTQIIVTNSANITVGVDGPDTLENLEQSVATWEPSFDVDGEPQMAEVSVDYNGWVWVSIPESWSDGQHSPELSERVGYVVGSDAQAEAEANE